MRRRHKIGSIPKFYCAPSVLVGGDIVFGGGVPIVGRDLVMCIDKIRSVNASQIIRCPVCGICKSHCSECEHCTLSEDVAEIGLCMWDGKPRATKALFHVCEQWTCHYCGEATNPFDSKENN